MHASAIIHGCCRGLVLAVIGLVLALILGLPPAAWAQSGQLTVTDILVEAQANDAVQAQLTAIERGQRLGLEQLVRQLAAGANQPVPSLQGVDVAATVNSFEIQEETIATGSYRATMTVSYDEASVRALLGEPRGAAATAAAGNATPPAVVVPLWETGSGVLLWERDNAWRDAVDRGVQQGGAAPLIVPLGDLQDLALLDANQAVRGDAQALGRLGARYGAESVILARLVGDGAGGGPLEIEARRVGGVVEPPFRSTVVPAAGEGLEQTLERAVREMQLSLDLRARERSMVPTGPGQRVTLGAPVSDPLSWGQLLGQLEGLPEVQAVAVKSLNRRQATLDVEVAGGVERLRQRLGSSGWNLIEDGADRWRLERGAPASAAPSPR